MLFSCVAKFLKDNKSFQKNTKTKTFQAELKGKEKPSQSEEETLITTIENFGKSEKMKPNRNITRKCVVSAGQDMAIYAPSATMDSCKISAPSSQRTREKGRISQKQRFSKI